LNCGQTLDGTSAVGEDAVPDPGDATICIYCGHLMAFDVSLKFRELTDQEVRDIAGDERILIIQRARRVAEQRMNKEKKLMPLNPAIAKLRLPARIAALPTDERGYPVPRFVHKIDGKPDFRVIAPGWLARAHNKKLCWVCGDKLGRHLAFVIGPMCAINRVSSEPASHLECARFSVQACPFLSHPERRRDERGLPEDRAVSGIAIARNPGVTLIWVTEHYQAFKTPDGGVLFEFGEPTALEWYARGRPATRAEIMHSIDTGLPLLRQVAAQEGADAVAALQRDIDRGLKLVPAA
jgi:hypothetical protein